LKNIKINVGVEVMVYIIVIPCKKSIVHPVDKFNRILGQHHPEDLNPKGRRKRQPDYTVLPDPDLPVKGICLSFI
jgi:hypothetical protein